MFHYRNPYDRGKNPDDWYRWNIGEEDGSRGMNPRGKSVAYKDGFNAGRYHALLASWGNMGQETPMPEAA